jgi:hypothetical protein
MSGISLQIDGVAHEKYEIEDVIAAYTRNAGDSLIHYYCFLAESSGLITYGEGSPSSFSRRQDTSAADEVIA